MSLLKKTFSSNLVKFVIGVALGMFFGLILMASISFFKMIWKPIETFS